jgi:hypothetical protein
MEEVIQELFDYINERPENTYEIIVGCDSSSSQEPNFPLAIVVLRIGEGGRFFLKRIEYKGRKFFSYKTRILEEVFLSCQMAVYLRENFEKKIKSSDKRNLKYHLRYIHADVGENGKTRDMIREVTGLIKGNGFEAKIKPDSFAASNVADRFS